MSKGTNLIFPTPDPFHNGSNPVSEQAIWFMHPWTSSLSAKYIKSPEIFQQCLNTHIATSRKFRKFFLPAVS